MTKSQRIGAAWEAAVMYHLRSGGLDVEQLHMRGTHDEGDLVVRYPDDQYLIIEAKAEVRIDLPAYLRELTREVEMFRIHRRLEPDQVSGLVLVKQRMAGVGRGYAVKYCDDYFNIGGKR
jgi:hypothetical protein